MGGLLIGFSAWRFWRGYKRLFPRLFDKIRGQKGKIQPEFHARKEALVASLAVLKEIKSYPPPPRFVCSRARFVTTLHIIHSDLIMYINSIDAIILLRVSILHAGYLCNGVQIEYLCGNHYCMLLPPPPQQSATGFLSSPSNQVYS